MCCRQGSEQIKGSCGGINVTFLDCASRFDGLGCHLSGAPRAVRAGSAKGAQVPPLRTGRMNRFTPQPRASLQIFEFRKGLRLFPSSILIVGISAHEFPRQFGVIQRENVVIGTCWRWPRRANSVCRVIHDTQPVVSHSWRSGHHSLASTAWRSCCDAPVQWRHSEKRPRRTVPHSFPCR